MAILKVARLGHPILRQVAEPVPTDRIRHPDTLRLIADMLETLEDQDGAGLAAPQVHASVRIVALLLRDDDLPAIWINPVIKPLSDQLISSYEGCLSIPGLRAAVPRYEQIEVNALDPAGQEVVVELEGMPAVVAQHECDHLDGILYIDRCDPRTLTFVEEYRRFGPWPLEPKDPEDTE